MTRSGCRFKCGKGIWRLAGQSDLGERFDLVVAGHLAQGGLQRCDARVPGGSAAVGDRHRAGDQPGPSGRGLGRRGAGAVPGGLRAVPWARWPKGGAAFDELRRVVTVRVVFDVGRRPIVARRVGCLVRRHGSLFDVLHRTRPPCDCRYAGAVNRGQHDGGACPPCKACPYRAVTGRCARPEPGCPHCIWLRDRIQEGEVPPVKRRDRRESA